MRFSFAFAALALLVAPVLAAPAVGAGIHRASGPKKEDHYIIKLNSGVDKKKTIRWLKENLDSSSGITFDYDSNFLNGFAAKLSPKTLEKLSKNKDVASIYEENIFTINTIQTTAPWGLQRITQSSKLTNQNANVLTYTYAYTTASTPVNVYILDTGINTAHVTFGGRATWGYSAISGQNSDGHGHGTHCAGTAVGALHGVAKDANVIAVKVLSNSGSGSTSQIISGINWTINDCKASGRPCIISMSLGGSKDSTLDAGIQKAIDAGIFVAVAAGNDNTNAQNTSPARVAAAFTVGASTIADARASFSNYGSIVDIFAPGQNVISAWIGSTTATNNISGTSMATPHVAGVAAYLLGQRGAMTPAALTTLIKSLGVSTKLTGIPSGTVNLLLQRGN